MKFILPTVLMFVLSMVVGCDDSPSAPADIKAAVTPVPAPVKQDAIALAIVVDCSGSMSESVSDGVKAEIARVCTRKIVQQAEQFVKARNKPVKIAIYKFDSSATQIYPSTGFAVPVAADAEPAIAQLQPNGGTAIGDAVIKATRDLNNAGFTSVNVLVVTDGENTAGTSPDDVSAAFAQLPESLRPNVFIVAFDVKASVFDGVKKNGWKVMSAANGTELSSTLDSLVGGEILLEK